MLKKIFILLVFVPIQTIFSQDICTDINGKKVAAFVDLEKKNKSLPFEDGTTHISMDDSAQPIIFRRKEKDIPDLLVYYTFSEKDSIVNEILYEWDVSNFEEADNNIKPDKFNNALIAKYNALLDFLKRKFGESQSKGNLEALLLINSKTGLRKSDNWKINDNFSIEMYTVVSNYYAKSGLVTINPTHRIRLYIRYRQK